MFTKEARWHTLRIPRVQVQNGGLNGVLQRPYDTKLHILAQMVSP